MKYKRSYYFALDRLVNNDIVNKYSKKVKTTLTTFKGVDEVLNTVTADFDEQKGSYLIFKDESQLNLNFTKTVNSSSSTLINCFFNYDKKDNNGKINIVKVGDKSFSIGKSLGRNAAFFEKGTKRNDGEFTIRENSWFNVSIYVSNSKVKIFVTDKNFIYETIPTISVEKGFDYKSITIGENKIGDILKISDLSIYEDVSDDNILNVINECLTQGLSLTSKTSITDSVDFKLYNSEEFDQLIIENEPQPIRFKFLTEDFIIENHENCKAILKVKKGFFVVESNDVDEENIEKSDTIFIQPNIDLVSDPYLKTTLEGVTIINALNQDKVLVQLKMYGLTLTSGNFSTIFTEEDSLIIDKVFEVKDLRGENKCPFEVFILGNDTLYNGQEQIGEQTIKLIINNVTDNDLVFSDTSGFRMVSNFTNTFKDDVGQTINYVVKKYPAATDIPSKKTDDGFIQFQDGDLLTKDASIVLEISGLKANEPSIECPSGTYPFYLEYKNIKGYRNGKVKFYLKTGKIFYSL